MRLQRLLFLLALLLTIWLTPATAEAGYYAITGTATRDGDIDMDGGMGEGCPPDTWRGTVYKIDEDARWGTVEIAGLDWYIYNKGFYSFDLTTVAGTVDSARVKICLQHTTSDTWNTDSEFYYGDCCIGTSCTGDLVVTDTSDCTDHLITIPWGDLPSPSDSMYLSVTAEQLGTVGSGHTFDLHVKSHKEPDVCATSSSTSNMVFFKAADEDTVALRPVLYVWTSGKKRVGMSLGDTDVWLLRKTLIRKENE